MPEALEAESSEDSMDGKGSRSESRPRCICGGGVSDLCRGDAAYGGGSERCGGWKAGGSEERCGWSNGAEVILAISGGIVGDGPCWVS